MKFIFNTRGHLKRTSRDECLELKKLKQKQKTVRVTQSATAEELSSRQRPFQRHHLHHLWLQCHARLDLQHCVDTDLDNSDVLHQRAPCTPHEKSVLLVYIVV